MITKVQLPSWSRPGQAAVDQVGSVLDLIGLRLMMRTRPSRSAVAKLAIDPLEQRPDALSRFALVHGSLDRRLLTRRLSAGKACSGWSSGPDGCGHATWGEGEAARASSRMTALMKVPETELWRLFPEENSERHSGIARHAPGAAGGFAQVGGGGDRG